MFRSGNPLTLWGEIMGYWVVVSNQQDNIGNTVSWLARSDGPFEDQDQAQERARELREELHFIIVSRAENPAYFDPETHKRLTQFFFWAIPEDLILDAPKHGIRVREPMTVRSIVEEADRQLSKQRQQGSGVKQRAINNIRMKYGEGERYRTELESLRPAASPEILQRDSTCIVTTERIMFIGVPVGSGEAVIEFPVDEISYLTTSGGLQRGDRYEDVAVEIGTLRHGFYLAYVRAPKDGASDITVGRRLEDEIKAALAMH
jgi:hypothetical protein